MKHFPFIAIDKGPRTSALIGNSDRRRNRSNKRRIIGLINEAGFADGTPRCVAEVTQRVGQRVRRREMIGRRKLRGGPAVSFVRLSLPDAVLKFSTLRDVVLLFPFPSKNSDLRTASSLHCRLFPIPSLPLSRNPVHHHHACAARARKLYDLRRFADATSSGIIALAETRSADSCRNYHATAARTNSALNERN